MYTRGQKRAEMEQAGNESDQEQIVEEIGEPLAVKETRKEDEGDHWQKMMMNAITTMSKNINDLKMDIKEDLKSQKEELKKDIKDVDKKQSEKMDNQFDKMTEKIESSN